MSHHFDTPTAFADGRINLCDLHVFPMALAARIHPDRKSPTPSDHRRVAHRGRSDHRDSHLACGPSDMGPLRCLS